jgi:AcrR family transcriptional regulator
MTEPAANRKHLILDAACRAIARTGAAAVRVSDVAREAGVSPRSSTTTSPPAPT